MASDNMELKEFETGNIDLYEDFVGFTKIHKELVDIVNFLSYLKNLTKDKKIDHKKMLIKAEPGSLFLGRTGTGKTYALHCVANEAKKLGYHLIDGKVMLKKRQPEPSDIEDFFDLCKSKAEEKPLLIAFDDARQLLGLTSQAMRMREFSRSPFDPRPMLEQFRTQIDKLVNFDYPPYIIITSVGLTSNMDEQITRRLSRHVIFSNPRRESRRQLFKYYISRFGYDQDSIDTISLSHLTEGVVAGKVEEIVSKASYKASMEKTLTNKLLVKEITRFLRGPPVDVFLTDEMKVQTGYHEFGGHTLPAYLVGLEPILVSIEPSADGTIGRNIHRPSELIPYSSSKHFFAEVITTMGSTAIYENLKLGKEEGRLRDLVSAKRSALRLYSLKNPTINMPAGGGDTFLTRGGVLSEETKAEVEREIKKIKDEALNIAKEMMNKYENNIKTFVEDYLVRNETMVRSEITTTLRDMGIKPGSRYKPMCQTLDKLGFLV